MTTTKQDMHELIEEARVQVGNIPRSAMSKRERLIDDLSAALTAVLGGINTTDCDHDFTDHCSTCGVSAREWFNR